jgi:cyanophycinase
MQVSALLTALGLSLSFYTSANVVDNAGNFGENNDKTTSDYNLMLVGGGLSTCSSFSPKNCLNSSFSDQNKQQALYQITESAVQSLLSSAPFLQQGEDYRADFSRVIKNIYAKLENKSLSSNDLRDAFARVNYSNLNGSLFYQEIPDSLYYAMLDFFEVRQLDDTGNRKAEVTDLAQSINPHSIAVYHRFVEMAKARLEKQHTVPRIAVITASSRDPFEVADFYLSVFQQAGAEVIWLPLDKSYRQARDLEQKGFAGCQQLTDIRAANGSYNREAIYPSRTALQEKYCQDPEQLLQQISQVQGVFFNGGDQSLSLAALLKQDGTDSEELQLIKQQMAAGKLVVGGTSAGTAVQSGGVFAGRPVPMISNGDSATAFARGSFATPPPSTRCTGDNPCGNGLQGSDLTYRARGGSGLFSLGILDTHFSERDREARLALLSTYTGTRFGFGVDEATALLVNTTGAKTQMEVLGQGGVFITDSQSGIYKLQDNKRQLVASSHYLNHGDRFSFDTSNNQLSFELAGDRLNDKIKVNPALEEGLWRRMLSHNCGTQEPLNWNLDNIAYVVMPTEDSRFAVSDNNGQQRCSYINLAFGIES